MTPAFELRGISKRFPGVLAVDRTDLAVAPGEIRALLGENGAGKTTLMGVLYGLLEPDAGEIRVAGEPRRFRSPLDAIAAGLGMVHQHFMLFDRLTVAENVVFGAEPRRRGWLDRRAAIERVASLAADFGLEVDPRATVGELPVGVRQRVEILKTLYRGARVFLLDEPTAVLTPAESESLFEVLERLAADGAAVVFITHKLPEVLALCERATVMRDGRVQGTVTVAESSPAELSRLMVGREVDLSLPVAGRRREGREAAEGPASGEPGAGDPGRRAETGTAGGAAGGRSSAAPVLEVEGLTVRGSDGRARLDGVDLRIGAGEILGLAGAAGNGQNELVEAIAGLRRPAAGRLRLAGRELTDATIAERRAAGLAWIPEDRDGTGLAAAASVAENLLIGLESEPRFGRHGLIDAAAVERHAAEVIARFGVKATSRAAADSLSGGNRQKLVVGRELARAVRLLIAEQPTRGVDLAATELVHRALIAYRDAGGAVLLVSAELTELRRLADRIAVVYEGRIAGELPAAEAGEEALGLLMAGGSAAA